MMGCNETRKWLSPYLDSELGHTKTFEVSEHLRACTACAVRFDEERRADEMMRIKLAAVCVPAELWSQVTQAVMTPLWVRRLRSRSGLAIAACLLLSMVFLGVFRGGREVQYRPWVARRFVAEKPVSRPFPFVPSDATSVRKALESQYGLKLAMWKALSHGHHDLELVSATPRKDSAGRAYLVVRLNCCNEPVLLVLARPQSGTWPASLRDVSINPGSTNEGLVRDLHVAARDIDGVRVVAVGRHAVGHIVESLIPFST